MVNFEGLSQLKGVLTMKSDHHNRLSRIPLSPYAWQAEAFKAAIDSDRRAAEQPRQDLTERDRLWLARGERLGTGILQIARQATDWLVQLIPTKPRHS